MFNTYTFGPLRVLVDSQTGDVASVQDKLTGCNAALLYSKADIAQASRLALQAEQSLYSEA